MNDDAARLQDDFGAAFTVSCDATADHGVTTGISATDRATTIRLAALGGGGVARAHAHAHRGDRLLKAEGGLGDSGFGRIHGADGLREFARPKAITSQRFAPPLALMTMNRKPRDVKAVKWLLANLQSRA